MKAKITGVPPMFLYYAGLLVLVQLMLSCKLYNLWCLSNLKVYMSIEAKATSVADLGGVRGVQMHPPLAASNVFCVHNCTSPSNDYAAVACSNNNQAQLHTHVSVPY